MLPNYQKNPVIIRPLALSFILLTAFFPVSAQQLFHYGKHAISKDEFLKAYNKNNTDSASSKTSYKNYFDLYSRFKLKVQAALDEKMDTSAEQSEELQSFRNQVTESFIKEDASMQVLIDEAFERGLKDIHVSDIFIPFPPNAAPEQISAAEAEINTIHGQLDKGVSFEKAGGDHYTDFGYITVFGLPYNIENIVYGLKSGQFSKPYKSANGFHIFRNNGERKAAGKLRIAQILLAYPPGATDQVKQQLARQADSVYNALRAGADFGEMAKTLSDDKQSFPAGGELPAFNTGTYEPGFEKIAFSLESDGDISKPFTTSFGYHILKRLQRIPVIENKQNKAWRETLKENVTQSDRIKVAQQSLVKNIRGKISKDADPQVLASDSAVLEYYKNNLEKYDAGFADQLREFKEGNLLFSIMQKKIWDPASSDSLGLMNYFNKHAQQYQWENSADALLITCLNKNDVDNIRSFIEKAPASWAVLLQQYNGQVQIDSGRFELSQIPVPEKTNFTPSLLTAPVVNEQDNSVSFAYILRPYPGKEQKSFEEARGAVISDYQNYLEEQWISELKKKYPVKLNKKVFNRLP